MYYIAAPSKAMTSKKWGGCWPPSCARMFIKSDFLLTGVSHNQREREGGGGGEDNAGYHV